MNEIYRVDNEDDSVQIDDRLAQAAKEGDTDARNALFLKHQPTIHRLGARARATLARNPNAHGPVEPQDIDQQLFLIFCDLLDAWQPGTAPFLPYMISTMPWAALHYVRKATRRGPSQHPRRHGAGHTPADHYEQDFPEPSEDSLDWLPAIHHVPGQQRRWLLLRFRQGMSSRQVASLTGYSHRTVNRELRAAISLIRDLSFGCPLEEI
ncbi:MAG TPA: sigma-70 family RNA polymerase sigma factor [Chloroflexia bacterium]|nr:sigma-70 family RNA polymerase sigma factor [Chloroflexia bacterium]